MGEMMGNRLSKIATRTGDDGTTGLGDGRRVRKDSARIAAIGDVDELNSNLGVLLCENLPDSVRAALVAIQHDLFDLGGELCIPGHTMITEQHLVQLDTWLADYNAALPPLKEFILPGGSRVPHGLPPRRTGDCRARGGRAGQCGAASVREPAVRPAVRARSRAESRGRWCRRAVATRASSVSLAVVHG
jgi:ATP:cob(I)alamin adenosyltransferase